MCLESYGLAYQIASRRFAGDRQVKISYKDMPVCNTQLLS